MRLNAKEQEQRALEYRYAYMMGYQDGYHTAMPMDQFVKVLLDMMDPVTQRRVKEVSKTFEDNLLRELRVTRADRTKVVERSEYLEKELMKANNKLSELREIAEKAKREIGGKDERRKV